MLCFVFDRRTCTMFGLHSAAVSHGMSAPIKYDAQKINERKIKQWEFERRGGKIQIDCQKIISMWKNNLDRRQKILFK